MKRRPFSLHGDLERTLAYYGITLDLDPAACARPHGLAAGANGYIQIGFESHRTYVHVLALRLKLGRPIKDGYVSRHRCMNRQCANPWHLEEGTPADNMHDQYRDGTRVRGERHPQAKLTDEQVAEIRSLLPAMSDGAIAARYGVARQTVNDIRIGRRRRL